MWDTVITYTGFTLPTFPFLGSEPGTRFNLSFKLGVLFSFEMMVGADSKAREAEL